MPQGKFKPAIIVPTYDNAATLGGVLAALAALELPIIVVNDGATDQTATILSRRQQGPDYHVVTHPHNRGKAAALRSGFAAADEGGFTHAVTFDSDGQLDPHDIPRMID